MNHWQKLGLPVALGICAAFLNWQSVSSKLTPRDYVAAKAQIMPGEKLNADSFMKISISHSAGASLEESLVPWSRVDSLYGRYAQREIQARNPLTQFDVCSANVAQMSDEESELEVHMSVSERENRALFVNDLVDLRYQGVRVLVGCRVLSIIRDKEDYRIRLATSPSQQRILEKRADFNPKDLKIYGHTAVAALSKPLTPNKQPTPGKQLTQLKSE